MGEFFDRIISARKLRMGVLKPSDNSVAFRGDVGGVEIHLEPVKMLKNVLFTLYKIKPSVRL